MYIFDFETKRWLGKADTKLPLTARAEAQAASLDGSSTYIFGGYGTQATGASVYYGDGIRFSNHSSGDISWAAIESLDKVSPGERACATLTMDSQNKRAFLVGGYETLRRGHRLFSDVWELQVSKRSTDSVLENSGYVCAYCGELTKCLSCSVCRMEYYCSASCQKSHWPQHKLKCKKK